MMDSCLASQPVENLLDIIIKSMGLDLAYRVVSLSGPSPDVPPQLRIELSGADAPLLTANNGELLHAIEHIAAKILNLESEQHDRISLDANSFKLNRDREIQRTADAAIARVLRTGQPHAFQPMTSRERRLLHLALQSSGLPTASSGLPPRRFVVLYPEAVTVPPPPTPARADNLRAAFRPR
jgi:spoIIIJ-associated protein